MYHKKKYESTHTIFIPNLTRSNKLFGKIHFLADFEINETAAAVVRQIIGSSRVSVVPVNSDHPVSIQTMLFVGVNVPPELYSPRTWLFLGLFGPC